MQNSFEILVPIAYFRPDYTEIFISDNPPPKPLIERILEQLFISEFMSLQSPVDARAKRCGQFTSAGLRLLHNSVCKTGVFFIEASGPNCCFVSTDYTFIFSFTNFFDNQLCKYTSF